MWENNIADTVFHYWLLWVVNMIYMFHMPMFFAISGAAFRASLWNGEDTERGFGLSRYPTFLSLAWDKAKRLLIPYIVIGLFYATPLKILSGYYDGLAMKDTLKYIVEGQLLLKGNNYLWFLIALWFIFLFVYLLEKYCCFHPLAKTIMLFLLSEFRSVFGGSLTFGAMENAIWFYLGYLWIPYRNKLNDWMRTHKYVPIVSFILLIVATYVKVKSNNQNITHLFLYMGIFAGVVFIYSVVLLVLEHVDKSQDVFKTCSSFCFGLYLYTDPLNYLVLKLYTDAFSITVLGNEIGAITLFMMRTVGISLIATAIVQVFRNKKIRYLY